MKDASDICAPDVARIPATPHVAILLALHDGAAHIDEQLYSIGAQTHANWSLTVSDDGSADGALERVADFAGARLQNIVSVRDGPRCGFGQNFLSMLRDVDAAADYVAFSDQDDWWMSDKLDRAIDALVSHAATPAFYGGRTVICDADLGPRQMSTLFSRPPSFENALVQNIAGGNTMVLNRPAISLLQEASDAASDIVAHDWWAYQVVSGAGGHVIYDPVPRVLYRQHAANQIGANRSLGAQAARAFGLVNGRVAEWNSRNMSVLKNTSGLLSSSARRTLADFAGIRDTLPTRRVSALSRSGVYRQSRRDDHALKVAALVGRL